MQSVLAYEPIVEALVAIMKLQIPHEKQLQDCLYSTTGIQGIDQVLNGAKSDVLLCFNTALEFSFNFTKLLDPNKNKFLTFAVSDGVTGVLKSLVVFCQNPPVSFEDIPKVYLCIISAL